VDVRRTLHLVRPGRAVGVALAAVDTVVYMEDGGYLEGAPPERQRRPVSPDELIQRIFAADLVVTW
jgi:hypothetical protein